MDLEPDLFLVDFLVLRLGLLEDESDLQLVRVCLSFLLSVQVLVGREVLLRFLLLL